MPRLHALAGIESLSIHEVMHLSLGEVAPAYVIIINIIIWYTVKNATWEILRSYCSSE